LKTRKKDNICKEKKFYMNFHLEDGFGEEFTEYEGAMLTEEALTSLTLY